VAETRSPRQDRSIAPSQESAEVGRIVDGDAVDARRRARTSDRRPALQRRL
jgi:hypothetical protein